jgi:hypothetical protein
VASKGINLKVSKVKLLTALKEKLNEVHTKQVDYLHQVKVYEALKKDRETQIKKIAIKNLDLITDVSERAHWGNDKVSVFELRLELPNTQVPVELEEPTPPYKGGRGYGRNYVSNDYDDIVADITNAIRMLELSDEDTINAATYANVAKYL